jgi:glycosyltransferase involved in cell wall biosynthesis
MSGTAAAQLTAPATNDHADRRTWLVMFSGSPLAAAAHRQQALARELAGPYRVLYVDPPSNAATRTFRIHQIGASLWQATVPAVLPLSRQVPPANQLGRWMAARLLRGWLDARPGPRLLWLDEDLAAPIVGKLGERAVVYDGTDLDWTFTRSWNRWHLRRSLHRAVAAADLVTVSSAALPSRLPLTGSQPVVVANACDPTHFRPDGPVTSWLDELPEPRIGYLGAVDTRALDGELVAAVARRHPEWAFVLAGPVTPAGRLPLAGLTNVHLTGRVPYEDVPALVRGFDVGLIPYRLGGLVDYVHPKKCFEYLANGLPVVSTPLPALRAASVPIRLASGPEHFGRAIAAALAEASDPAAARHRREVAVANSWQARGEQLRALLAALPGGAALPVGAARPDGRTP